jgi:hypothetical protein
MPPNQAPPSSQPAASTAEPGFANSMLFKTAAVESPTGAPVAPNPFALPQDAAAVPGLTVGDLLPGLPSDVAKNPGLSPDQALTLPDAVLESALRSGRASIPLFELFRACPMMFLGPVGPHDPREVPLPPHKIASLIPGSGTTNAPRNPFSMMPTEGARVPSSPFGVVTAPREDEPPAATAVGPAQTAFHPSPFGLMMEPAPSSPATAEGGRAPQIPDFLAPAGSFGSAPTAEQPMAPSPFMSAPATSFSSPFSLAPAPAPGASPSANASPFLPSPPSFADTPASQPAAALPAFPSMFNGPVVQSVPGVGSSSEDSSFFSAAVPPVQAATAPFPQPSPAPASPPPSWGSIFPFQAPAESAAPALPGVGATFFPVEQTPLAAESPAPAENAPINPAGFFSSFGLPPAPAPVMAEVSPEPSQVPAASGPTETAAKPFNPFERIQALAKSAEAASQPPADPFLSKAPTETVSLFGGNPLPPAPEPERAPAPLPPTLQPQAASLHPGEKSVKLDLAASLKNCAAHDLGTNPENIPSWVQFTLPYEMLADQLSTGRVVVPLDAIVAGLDAPIRALFSQARSGVEVELPSNAVFHAVSELAPSAMPQVPPEESASAAAPAPAPREPFMAPIPENLWKESAPEPPASSSILFGNSHEPVPAPSPPAEAPPAAETTASFAQPVPAPAPLAPPSSAEPVVIPANPLTGAPEFVSPAPVLPPQGSFAVATTPRSDNGNRRLLLTVLLGSPDATDVVTIVRLTQQLPGVAAVLCVEEGRSIAEAGDGSAEARRFLQDAPRKISGLTALASLTGIEDAETLHIQSGQVEATFCLQGEITFAVLHDPRRREAMLKEKITLLGRELAAILGESSSN